MDNIPQDDTPYKQCHGPCKQFLPATPLFFSRNKAREDGLQLLCKSCTSEYKRQHYQRNKERINEKSKEYRKNNKESLAERQKRYYQENRERILENNRTRWAMNRDHNLEMGRNYKQYHRENLRLYSKMYYTTHKKEVLAHQRQYGILHRDTKNAYLRAYLQTEHGKLFSRVHSHKRRAKKSKVGGSYTSDQLQDQLKRQKHKCYWCGAKLGKGRNAWHADHIVPLSRENTSNEIGNIVIACPPCNLQRSNKLPHEWPEGGRLL